MRGKRASRRGPHEDNRPTSGSEFPRRAEVCEMRRQESLTQLREIRVQHVRDFYQHYPPRPPDETNLEIETILEFENYKNFLEVVVFFLEHRGLDPETVLSAEIIAIFEGMQITTSADADREVTVSIDRRRVVPNPHYKDERDLYEKVLVRHHEDLERYLRETTAYLADLADLASADEAEERAEYERLRAKFGG